MYTYDNCMIRPCMGRWAIYHVIGLNKAEILFQGTREECQRELKQLCERGE
jgi:hypothetical protein